MLTDVSLADGLNQSTRHFIFEGQDGVSRAP